MHSFLLSLLIVLLSNSDGTHKKQDQRHLGKNIRTIHYVQLQHWLVKSKDQFNEIIAMTKKDESHKLIQKEYDFQKEGLDDVTNPFKLWAEKIHTRILSSVQGGIGYNAFH